MKNLDKNSSKVIENNDAALVVNENVKVRKVRSNRLVFADFVNKTKKESLALIVTRRQFLAVKQQKLDSELAELDCFSEFISKSTL